MNPIVHMIDVSRMVKPEKRLGEFPATKEVYKNFLKVAWPSAVEALLVSLVGFVDTMMVSTLGENAIAAVGITNQPKFILLAAIFALNVGVTAVTARRKGQNDREGANQVFRSAIFVCALIAIIMSTFGFFFAEPLLHFAGAVEVYMAEAVPYFKILVVSVVFTALNLTVNAAQRGSGNTKISMRTNVIANLVNVLFNYLLINGHLGFPKLGVAGAGIATCLGAMVACLVSFLTLCNKKGYLNIYVDAKWKIEKQTLQPILKVSSSAFIEQVFMRIGFFSYAVIVAKLGVIPYATHLICMNILNISFSFGDGFAIAASSLVGQNLGAGRQDLATVYGKTGQKVAFVASTFLFFVFLFARYPLVSLFSDEAAVIELGATIMIIMAFTTHMQTSQVVFSGCLRGAGDSAFVALTSLISVAIIRPVLTYTLCFPLGLGLQGAWLALMFDQIFRVITAAVRFYSGKWARIIL